MRKREIIELTYKSSVSIDDYAGMGRLILEVLLDLRDLLKNGKQKV